ncbi:MAG: hypothetical protein HRU06_06320 [Oceanospirillaceae bacterium]|nr:hypothetical protein [Oceanospirillaceae bacterium]
MKNLVGFWYTFVVVTLLLGAFTGVLDQYSYEGGWNEAPLYAKIGIPTVLITFFGFWILMLADFFKHKDTKWPILVGFSLFFLHWLAIFVYFWMVVYRRKNT